jgi:amino acid permease
LNLTTSLSVVIVAYAFHYNIFNIQDQLQDKSSTNTLAATGLGLLFAFIIYVTVGILGIYSFGSAININMLQNVGQIQTFSNLLIRFSFWLVLACHIPYTFFPLNQTLLILVDEFRRNTLSQAIELKI